MRTQASSSAVQVLPRLHCRPPSVVEGTVHAADSQALPQTSRESGPRAWSVKQVCHHILVGLLAGSTLIAIVAIKAAAYFLRFPI